MKTQNYALKRLDTIIDVSIRPSQVDPLATIKEEQPSAKTNWTATQVQQWLEEISREIDLVKQDLLNKDLVTGKGKKRIQLVRSYEAEIIHLLDTVYYYEQFSADSFQLYACITSYLQHLLRWLKNRWPDCFNEDKKIPAADVARCRQQLAVKIELLQKLLAPSAEDASLVHIALQAVDTIVNPSEEDPLPTFHQLAYCNQLLAALEHLDQHRPIIQCYTGLVELLVYLNYNSLAFKKYLFGQIEMEISRLETIEEQIDRLHFHCTRLLQLPVKEGMALEKSELTVQDEVVKRLQQEIRYLEGKIEMAEANLKSNLASKDGGDNGLNDKTCGFLTSLSATQVALMVRLLKESGILCFTEMEPFMRQLAGCLHTETKKGLVSPKYLANSYFSPGINTVNSVMEKVMTIHKILIKIKQE